MNRRKTVAVMMGGFGVVLGVSQAPAGRVTLVGTGPGTTLFDVDMQTGRVTNPRGSIGGLAGIAMSPGGDLYGISDDEAFYTLDPFTGSATRVGGVPLPFGEGDIDFDPTTGLLYGVGFTSARPVLVLIDLLTGTPTVVGTVAEFHDPSAMAFDSGGSLYVIDVTTDTLLLLDKTNANVLSILPLSTPLGANAGMDFDPDTGILFVADGGTDSTDTLYTLATDTGQLTVIGATQSRGVAGLDFIPDPGTFVLLGLGALLVGKRRGRRGQQNQSPNQKVTG